MERVIELLREKNFFLEKFYFVNEQELLNFSVGDFEQVEAFYQARDKILELIGEIDETVAKETTASTGTVSAELRREAEHILSSRDELVKQILAQDLQILEYIEKEKSHIIRELSSNTKARKAVGAYAQTERAKQLEE